MTGRSGSSDGTFYFQAWNTGKVVTAESWVQNKGLADFVEQNLSAEAKQWLFVKGCVPTKELTGLAIPYSIAVKLRAAKSGQDPKDAVKALFKFRNKEFPDLARVYFKTRLHKSLDWFNAFSEGAESDPLVADFNVVKSSKKLKDKVRSAIKFVKKDVWGDLKNGLIGGISSKSEFKAARFIAKRGQGMYRAFEESDIGVFGDIGEADVVNICLDFSDPTLNPHVLPTAPLQSPFSLPDLSSAPLQPGLSSVAVQPDLSSAAVQPPVLPPRRRTDSDASDLTVGSTVASVSDASSMASVDTAQSSIYGEDASELHHYAKEGHSELSPVPEEDEPALAPPTATKSDPMVDADVEVPAVATPADASEASCQDITTEPIEVADVTVTPVADVTDVVAGATDITEVINATTQPAAVAPVSSSIVATRRKMSCVLSSQNTKTAYFVVQNAGNWLKYLTANHAQSAQQLRSAFFDSPIVLAANLSPVQALTPDGMMRVYFMSQARKQLEDGVPRNEKNRAVRARKGKSVREWIVGSAKVSTRTLKHLGQQLGKRNARLLPPAVRKVDSVVGPNNRLIEMTPAPGVPQAILVTTPHPVEDVREGDIVQEERDDGFVHIESNIVNRPVEVVTDRVTTGAERKVKGERRRRLKGKGKLRAETAKVRNTTKMDTTNTPAGARADVITDSTVDANSAPPRKPSKVYTPPFSRKAWRDVEPQEPQVIYDVMSGYDFLQVEDVQVFSFSTSSHDMMLRTSPPPAPVAPVTPAVVEEGEGLGIWSPPAVVGIFSWMWDHLSPGPSHRWMMK
ncbi:uncharacterized protein TRIREDRAFT_120339 [Trichoderma reesei QM6a]|uniref:Predicted protein n=1 Tax=Hypocrea jecorina (strain QM6a) TaxID=431241 RepID=G0RBK3_HYPJQ|nr:uncharacterized protein TRIREDRAFT_120339 [Trichoderma reesei QM6a]EGR51342.1 predicted protein [Trichoderma reesei QM6a]